MAPAVGALVTPDIDAVFDAAHDNIPEDGATKGVHNLVDHMREPTPENAQHGVMDHFVPETTAFVVDAAEPDNTNVIARTGALDIVSPASGAWTGNPLVLQFQTTFPTSTTGPRFFIESSTPGTDEWLPLTFTRCPGVEPRTCSVTVPHALNEDRYFRVYYESDVPCAAGQCDAVLVKFDSSNPTSAAQSLPRISTSVSIPVAYTHGDNRQMERVELWARYEDGAFARVDTHTSAALDGTFEFIATNGPGRYAFHTRAYDAAGNAEPAKSGAEATTDLVLGLKVTPGVSRAYVTNDDLLTITACVKRLSGADVTAADGATVTATFLGNTYALAAPVAGCTWTASIASVSGIEAISQQTVAVEAKLGSATGDGAIAVTASPERLVLLSFESRDAFVEVGDLAKFRVKGIYADTLTPASGISIGATGLGSTSAMTNTQGVASFQFTSATPAIVDFAFGPTGSFSFDTLATETIWTDLVGELSVAHASYYNNVGEAFETRYCVEFTHVAGMPADNVLVTVTTGAQSFMGVTAANGCVAVGLPQNVVGNYTYATHFGYDVLEATYAPYDVFYTEVLLSTTTTDDFVNVGDAPMFTICGVYAGNDQLAVGAAVELRSGDAVLESGLELSADGCVETTHTFDGLFDGVVGAKLIATPEEVTKDDEVLHVVRQVATEVLASYTTADAFVQPGETITYTLDLSYATGEDVEVGSTVTLTGPGRAADACVVALPGVATCSLTSAAVYAESFGLAVDTPKGIQRIAAGDDASPMSIWTLAHIELDAVDTVVDLGTPVDIAGSVVYTHGAAPTPMAAGTLQILDENGAVITTTPIAQGAFSKPISFATVYDGPVSVRIASSDTGVTTLDEPAAHESLVWTIVDFSNIAVNDAFANVGQTVTVTGNAVFGHGPAVASGTVDILRDGDVLGTAQIVDGAFSQTIVLDEVFDGDLALVLTSAQYEISLYSPDPLTTPMVWTQIVLAGSISDALVNVGDAPVLSGTAVYAHGGNVENANYKIILDDGTTAATGTITDGAFSTPVQVNTLYNGKLRMVILDSDTGVTNQVTTLPVDVVYTQVVGEASIDDGFVARGDTITVTYLARYANTDGPASFTVLVEDGCGFSQTITGTDGVATVGITHADVCSTTITANLVATTDGITRQDPANVVAAMSAIWTKITVLPVVDDAFATLGQEVTVSGMVHYDHDALPVVASATMTVTDDAGDVFCSAPVVDGAFACTGDKTETYVGRLHFAVSEGDEGVDLQTPASALAKWTTILLTVGVSDAFVAFGDDVVLTGTADFDGDLGPVPGGTLQVRSADGTLLDTVDIVDGAWTATVNFAGVYVGVIGLDVASSTEDIESDSIATGELVWTRIELVLTAPADLFVNTIDTISYEVAATYAHGVPVTDATITAYAADNMVLGVCEIADGGCTLDLTTANDADGVYAGVVRLAVTRGYEAVTLQSPALLETAELVWTKLLVSYTHATGPFGVEEAAEFAITIRYAHNLEAVADALAIIDGFSIGDQSDFTDATGFVEIAGIEEQAGERTLVFSAIDATEGIDVFAVSPSPSVTLRWTALAFTPFTYSVTPIGYNAQDGGPIFRTNTLVNVCTRVNTADDANEFVPSALVQLRGSLRTASATTAAACYPMKFTTPRDVEFTARGISGVIEGKTIYASEDRTVTIHFVN